MKTDFEPIPNERRINSLSSTATGVEMAAIQKASNMAGIPISILIRDVLMALLCKPDAAQIIQNNRADFERNRAKVYAQQGAKQ